MYSIRYYIYICLVLLGCINCWASEPYRLGAEDVLQIEIWGEAELSGNYTVDAAGTIRRSWLTPLKVAGMTLAEANKAFEVHLKKFIKEPRVKMEVAEYKSHRVSMIGGVTKPGTYNLSEKNNFLTILLQAGGLAPRAKGEAVVIRAEGAEGELKRFPVDVSKLLNQADASQDIELHHGDVVYFPVANSENGDISTSQSIVVTGAVNKMGSYPYREGYTALNAILDAGGFTKFASPNRARIVRGQGKDEKTIRIDLGDVVNRGDKAKNMVLLPGDIIVVPEGLI